MSTQKTLLENSPIVQAWLLRIALLGAGLFTAAFFYVALGSMFCPFALEWMEGQMLDVVARVMQGKPLYVAPTLDYVPFIYTPLYFYVVAALSYVTTLDFWTARLVSLISAVGCGALIAYWVSRESKNRNACLLAAGMFFATYVLSGRWFDLARVDSLFLLLLLSGCCVLYYRQNWQGVLLSAILLTGAFFTKQSALMIFAPVLLVALCMNAQRGAALCALLMLLIGGGVALANYHSGGWFNFYIFHVPAQHALRPDYYVMFWLIYIVLQMGALMVPLCMTLWDFYKRDRAKLCFFGALFTGCLAYGYSGILHEGGYHNVMMPTHAAAALIVGMGLAGWLSRGQVRKANLALLLIVLQLLSWGYDPRTLIPTAASQQQAQAFVEQLKTIDGDVLMPEMQFIQKRAGKESYDLSMAAVDILRDDLGNKRDVQEKLRTELDETIKNKRFAAIMPGCIMKLPQTEKYYPYKHELDYPDYVAGGNNHPCTILYLKPKL